MPTRVTGKYPHLTRRRTGLFSLDLAVANKGELGYPMRTATEIYGYPNSGKSTLAYYLASVLSRDSRVVICDLEWLDRKYIQTVFDAQKFDGEVKIIDSTDDKGKPRPHEKMLLDMKSALYEDGTGAAIWDSLSQTTSIDEMQGEFGEAFWGKRARLNNQVARSLGSILRNKAGESVMFGVNHVKGLQGGRGHTTPGGDDFKDMSAVRMMLWTDSVWRRTSESDSEVIGFQVSGQIEKLRFGGRGAKFGFYIVPGFGVHPGASAMFDCFTYGVAEQGNTVKMGGKSLGYIRKDLLSYAATGRMRKFTPFLDALEKHEKQMEKEMKDDGKED